MSFIDQKEIFEKTNGGRMVIEAYYPDSVTQGSFDNPTKKFRIRDEDKTRSCSVKLVQPDGVWIVTDFGGDDKKRNAIAIVMLEENCTFPEALQLIAQRFGIVPEERKMDIFRPEIRQRDATPDEIDGVWYFDTKDFTMVEVLTIIAPKVWEYLVKQAGSAPSPSGRAGVGSGDPLEAAMAEVVSVFRRYHFHSLKGYKVVKNRKTTEIESTESYPIFMFDEMTADKKVWRKIYQPKNPDPGKRFMHYGGRPADFIFGYEQAHKAYQEITAIKDEEEDIEDDEARKHKEKKDKKKPKKLERVIITAGGSDGLNIACIGQCFKSGKEATQLAAKWYPVWMNSETGKLSPGQFRNLQMLADKVYNIPDIDTTGRREAHELATEHLEIHTITLPEELRTHKDIFRNKVCKDLRDYFRFWTPWDFEKLFKTAYPYRFWDMVPRYNKQGEFQGMGYNVNNKYMLNFLQKNGFYRYAADSEKDMYFYIHIQNNVVSQVEPKKIRDYINAFIEKREPVVELMNTFLRSTQMNETSLSNLPFTELDFNDHDNKSQWVFFKNRSVRVTSEAIEEYRPGQTDKYVWDEEVIGHSITRLPDMFTITRDAAGEYDITIHNQKCLVLRFLINISRVFWREELEYRIDGIPDKDRESYAVSHNLTKEELRLMDGLHRPEQDKYRQDNKFNIAGPLLTAAEQREQKLNLINKLFAIGYMLHRHKDPSKAWAVWSMDAKMSDGDESHGGTGKSLLPTLLSEHKIIKSANLSGRNLKLTDNPHIYEGITEHTDLVFVDDSHRYLKFDFFFQAITGSLPVNPKNAKQYTISPSKSPKFWFTSNFPPDNIDPSKERRILYTMNSDYYHYNKMDEYKEERGVRDDFGKNLGNEFTPAEWNLFMNLLLQCLRFYLTTDKKVNPPMDNVNRRNLKAGMGDTFESWADVYFSEESDRINPDISSQNFVIKTDALKDFVDSTKQAWTMKKFTSALKAWCHYNDYILNPADVKGWVKNKNDNHGRIIQKVKLKNKDNADIGDTTKEMIYILAVKKAAPEEKMPF